MTMLLKLSLNFRINILRPLITELSLIFVLQYLNFTTTSENLYHYSRDPLSKILWIDF